MKDTFNSIRKYEKYEVNKDGVVRNASTQQQLPQINTPDGAWVIITQNKRTRFVSIIQLVAETHLDMWFQMSKGGWGIIRKDGNIKNNSAKNADCYRLEIEDVEDNKYHELLDFIMNP
tara:strand:- start:251 stop:604 length:354 start_codon:yes stop_codon:yes gene_type:complete